MAAQPVKSESSDPTAPAVMVSGLSRSFGSRAVLRDIDLDIAGNEFVALLGRSGSGKSTLLRILAGLDREVYGRVRVPARRSVVFQDPRLLPWSRVIKNVVLGLKGADSITRGQRALEEVGLVGHERDWPKTLSGGEAQRVALARALVRDPELLLLDEPFGALDALTRIRMHGLLGDLCARHRPAVLLVTHDVEEAIVLADRILVLADGGIILDLPGLPSHLKGRRDPAFADLRTRLLGALGVKDGAEVPDLPTAQPILVP